VQVRGLHSFAGSRLGEPVALCAVGDHQGNAVAPGGLPKPAEAPGAPPVPLHSKLARHTSRIPTAIRSYSPERAERWPVER